MVYNFAMGKFALLSLALLSAAVLLLIGFNNCSGGGFKATSLDGSAALASTSNCPMAPTALRDPQNIDQMTNLINALPKPLSLNCVIENLPKPLNVSALQSAFSAQPSESALTPRVFIIIKNSFILSVVPTGLGKNLLEMSEIINGTESVKAELLFPIDTTLALTAPYDRIRAASGGSNCNFCHKGERTITTGYPATAFASELLRPDNTKFVSSAQSRQAALTCNQVADPYRCNLMKAIFINGQAQDVRFP